MCALPVLIESNLDFISANEIGMFLDVSGMLTFLYKGVVIGEELNAKYVVSFVGHLIQS